MRNIIRSHMLFTMLVALLALCGCGGGGGGGGAAPAGTPSTIAPVYTPQPGESGVLAPQFLSYTTLSNTTVGWGKQQGASGTIVFNAARTGTFTASSPAVNAPMAWTVVNRAITVTVASTPAVTYTYAQIAVNTAANYYVMMKSQVAADGTLVFVDYERWYLGAGGAAAAQAFAATVTVFTTDLVSGKKLQNIAISSPLWTGSAGASPAGVAVDANGGIYVVNASDNTVQKFTTASTTPVWTGLTDQNPLGVAVDANGGIYVVNSSPNPTTNLTTVQKFTTASTAPVGTGTITGTFPNSIAVDPTGSSIYITCAQSNTLVKFPALTSTVTPATPVWTVTTGLNPDGVALDAAGNIYVANFASNTVQQFSPAAGALLWTGATAAGPAGVAVDKNGGIYVACATANVVQKFTTAATTPVWTAATGLAPDAVAVDATTGVYVASSQSNIVQKFTAAATTPVWTGNTGTLPSGVAVDATGGIFVSSAGSSQVQKFAVTGSTTVYSLLANSTFTSTVTPLAATGSGTWVVNSDGTLTLNFINPTSWLVFTVLGGSTTSSLNLSVLHSDGSPNTTITMTFI